MDELKNVLSKIAPFLGSVIGSANPIAGVLFNSIASLFGLDSTANPEFLADVIKKDPYAASKLRELEIQHSDEILRTEAQVRLGAYNREIEITKATGRHDWVLSCIALFLVTGFFVYSFFLFFVHVDTTVHDIVMFLAGQISSMAVLVVSYYFGATVSRAHGTTQNNRQIILPPPAQTR